MRKEIFMQLRKLSHGLTLSFARAACALSIAAALPPALASAPVPKTFVGCVANGVYTNEDGYVIRIHQSGGALMDLSCGKSCCGSPAICCRG
jgi:hypothetical protein